jgi:catechol 2,3-dioxygenase-like lactoylglutathione lyase family enzyme
MEGSLRHIALFVPDLQAAENYYKSLFDMELIGREAELEDGLWYTLPFDLGWNDAIGAGIELEMVALRKDEIVLALFAGDATQGQVFAIGISLSQDEISGIRSRLPADAEVDADLPDNLVFRDPYQIIWQISVPGDEFQTAGKFAGRWLKI